MSLKQLKSMIDQSQFKEASDAAGALLSKDPNNKAALLFLVQA